jgi:hypothetical protein
MCARRQGPANAFDRGSASFGGGAALVETAIAVTLSAVRLLPLVVSLIPILRGAAARNRDLICLHISSP